MATIKSAWKKQVNGRHYKQFAIQPSEFIYKNNLNWFEGNAIKYICRHRVKGGRVDVEKAMHYLELLLETYSNGNHEGRGTVPAVRRDSRRVAKRARTRPVRRVQRRSNFNKRRARKRI